MGWEIAALWIDDPHRTWCWVWRRIENDTGRIVKESGASKTMRSASKTRRGLEDACAIDAHGELI